MITLKPGESQHADIDSFNYWNATGIVLEKDGIYDLVVDPAGQTWTDGATGRFPQVCDADGFSQWFLNLFSCMKRSPADRWFTLMGAIAKDSKTQFRIGTARNNFSPGVTGELSCFANDADKFYKNNQGVIRLRVHRLG
jgi:hypothetical protein